MPDKPTPLEILADQLRSFRPPSLGTLIGMIEDNQYYADFVHLVKEFLPERERDILNEAGPESQIAKFADYFEDRYFPLPQYLRYGEADEYAALVNSIPLIALGFGYQDYDDLIANGGDGYQLMTYFFRQPYDDQGARVAMGESCQAHVPAELLQRLPEGGYSPEEIHKLLDGTPYRSLALWGDMIHLSTGNDFLDVDEEMMGNSVPPEWTRENVEYFTRAWAEAEEKQEATNAMARQFDEKPQEFFQEIIDFIDKRKEAKDGTNSDQGTHPVPVGAA